MIFCDLGKPRPGRPAQLISYDPQGPDRQANDIYMTAAARCAGDEIGKLARRMFGHALRNALEFTGPVYAVHLLDGAEQYLLQISVAVKRNISKK
jgi:hypothetical protein